MGSLTDRWSDGLFQPNFESNAFVLRVKALLELGCRPNYIVPLYTEFPPVDCAEGAVVRIAQRFNQRTTVFHVNSEKGLYFTDLLPMLQTLGVPMEVVTGQDFARRFKEIGGWFAYEALIKDLDEHGQLVYDSNIRIHNGFTVEYLQRLGFNWSVVGIEYIRNYTTFYEKTSYWGNHNDR